MAPLLRPAAAMIRAARTFYVAEVAGGLLYRRLAEAVGNEDVRHALDHFADDEYRHADWYLDWLLDRGVAPARLDGLVARVAPAVARVLAARSLEGQLELFSAGEAAAARHLRELAPRIHDTALRAIVERTIPAEQGHADWYPEVGRGLLSPADRLRHAGFVFRPAAPSSPR